MNAKFLFMNTKFLFMNTKFLIMNTKFLFMNVKFLIMNTKFLFMNAKFLIMNVMGVAPRRYYFSISWLLSINTSDIQVLKTELNLEPIRADSVTFLQIANQILHLEFQTTPKSKTPLDFRMLDYYTRLKREYWCEIK